MSVYARAFSREVLTALAVVFGLVVLVMLSINGVNFLADAASGKLTARVVAELLVLQSLATLPDFVPLCLMLAVTLSLGRARRDLELVALAAAGVGPGFWYRTVARLAVLVAVLTAVLSFVVAPWADGRMKELEARAEREAQIFGIVPGRFREFGGGDRVLFVERASADRQRMEEVFLQVREPSGEGVLSAATATVETLGEGADRFVVFGQGRRYDGRPGEARYAITRFERYAVRLDSGGGYRHNPMAMSLVPTHELVRMPTPRARAELHWRLSMPLAAVLLALTGVALTRASPLAGRYGVVVLAVLVYFVYSNLLGVTKTLTKQGQLDALVGLWPVHLMLLAAVLAIELAPRYRRRPRR